MSDQINPTAALGIAGTLAASAAVLIQYFVKRGSVDLEKERLLLVSGAANIEEIKELRQDVRMCLSEREQAQATITALTNKVAALDVELKLAQAEIRRLLERIITTADNQDSAT